MKSEETDKEAQTCERCEGPIIGGAWIIEHWHMADETVCEKCYQAYYFEE